MFIFWIVTNVHEKNGSSRPYLILGFSFINKERYILHHTSLKITMTMKKCRSPRPIIYTRMILIFVKVWNMAQKNQVLSPQHQKNSTTVIMSLNKKKPIVFFCKFVLLVYSFFSHAVQTLKDFTN